MKRKFLLTIAITFIATLLMPGLIKAQQLKIPAIDDGNANMVYRNFAWGANPKLYVGSDLTENYSKSYVAVFRFPLSDFTADQVVNSAELVLYGRGEMSEHDYVNNPLTVSVAKLPYEDYSILDANSISYDYLKDMYSTDPADSTTWMDQILGVDDIGSAYYPAIETALKIDISEAIQMAIAHGEDSIALAVYQRKKDAVAGEGLMSFWANEEANEPFTPRLDVDVLTGGAATPVSSVSLDKETAEINMGTTTQLTASVSPFTATDKTATWESRDESIASVDANGLVTGIGDGDVYVVVIYK